MSIDYLYQSIDFLCIPHRWTLHGKHLVDLPCLLHSKYKFLIALRVFDNHLQIYKDKSHWY